MCVNFKGSFLVTNILNLCPQSKSLEMALLVINVCVSSVAYPPSRDEKLRIRPSRERGNTGVGRVWRELTEREGRLFPDE